MPQVFPNSLQAVRLLPHRSYDKAQCVGFVGKRGFGKTVALSSYIDECEPRVFALDPFEDFKSIRMRVDLEEAIAEMAEGLPLRRRVVPPIDAGSRAYAERFFALAIDHLENCLIVLDELTLWSGPRESTALQTLVLQGRRKGLRMAVACQRISLVPDVLKSEMTQMVCFCMTRPRDLRVLADWTDEETAKEVSGLGVGECILVEL